MICMANKNEYDDLQIASEASAIVMRNLDRIPGEKKYKGSGSMFICCPNPNHPDHSPSCLLNLVDNDRYKAGMAKCFSCPEGSGFFHWNQIADWLNLERISDEDRAQIYVTRPNFDLYEKDMFGDDESEDVQDLKLDDICKSLRIPLHLPWGDQKWRSIRPKVMQRIGAHYGLAEPESPSQQQQAEMAVVLPVMVQHQLVGAVKARWKKQKGVSSYINSKGAWSSTKGLFLIDQAVKKGRTAILCEGPRDALRLVQGKLPGVAILGSKSWSKTKRDLLANCGIENIILCFDQDDAGDEAIETVGKDCFGYFQCKNFSLRKWGKRLGLEGLDPGNMPELLVQKLHNMWARMEGWDE